MSKKRELTEVYGLKLKSELTDPTLYNIIRSLQFLFLHTYKLDDKLIIEETSRKYSLFYLIENKQLNLRGYIGRDAKNNIEYLIVDQGRLKWAKMEGFDLLNGDIMSKVGFLMRLANMADFILFMAGRGGWSEGKYIRE